MRHVPTTAELINQLFATHPNPATGRTYTPIEIVVASRGRISPSHLHRLRAGSIKSPTRETLLAFCEVFCVQCSYFFPELADRSDLTPE